MPTSPWWSAVISAPEPGQLASLHLALVIPLEAAEQHTLLWPRLKPAEQIQNRVHVHPNPALPPCSQAQRTLPSSTPSHLIGWLGLLPLICCDAFSASMRFTTTNYIKKWKTKNWLTSPISFSYSAPRPVCVKELARAALFLIVCDCWWFAVSLYKRVCLTSLTLRAHRSPTKGWTSRCTRQSTNRSFLLCNAHTDERWEVG